MVQLALSGMAERLEQGLVHAVRQYGSVFLAHCQDPHAELLALVWGPQFDRQQAQSLLLAMAAPHVEVWRAATHAAEGFDRLSASQQHRLRHLILRHQRRCHNFPCPEFS